MKQISLILTALICCSMAQGAEKPAGPKTVQPEERKASPTRQKNLKITVAVGGKTITSLSLAELPKDAKVEIKAASISSNQVNKPGTMELGSTIKLSGKASLVIHQGDKELLHVAVEDGIITIEGLEDEADKFKQYMEGLIKSQAAK